MKDNSNGVVGQHGVRRFIYGGMAAIVAEFGTFPIDTTKTRLQIQGQKNDHRFTKLRYHGMIDAMVKITKEEGLRSLYSGLRPAVLRQSVYGTIKFGAYYTLKDVAQEHGLISDGADQIWANIMCATAAGVISSTVANPTDVLKVRMQVHGRDIHRQMNLWSCFYEIYKYEGLQGLWRGVIPTAQRAVTIASVELPLYDFCKSQFMPYLGNHTGNHFISSFVASFGSAIASTPIDVVRTRLMNQRLITSRNVVNQVFASPKRYIYTSSLDCAVQTIKNEGVLALYKGFIPTWLRMGPWNVIFFITYEQLNKY